MLNHSFVESFVSHALEAAVTSEPAWSTVYEYVSVSVQSGVKEYKLVSAAV